MWKKIWIKLDMYAIFYDFQKLNENKNEIMQIMWKMEMNEIESAYARFEPRSIRSKARLK